MTRDKALSMLRAALEAMLGGPEPSGATVPRNPRPAPPSMSAEAEPSVDDIGWVATNERLGNDSERGVMVAGSAAASTVSPGATNT